MPRPSIDEETLRTIRESHAAGGSYAAIGRAHGLTPLAVKKALATQDTTTAVRETEHFVVDEPPKPRPAPKNLLEQRAAARDDRKTARADDRADEAYADEDRADEDCAGADYAGAAAVADLRRGIDAADAGVDDEGFVEAQLERALDLLRGGAISLPEYIRATARLTQHSRRGQYDADPAPAYEPAPRRLSGMSAGATRRGVARQAGGSRGDREAPRRKYLGDPRESAESRVRASGLGRVAIDVAAVEPRQSSDASDVVAGALSAIRGYSGR